MDKLILFDIDGTLINGFKTHKEAFSESFKKVYGINTNIESINYHGMTDQQIIMEVLRKNGLEEEIIKSKMEDCIKIMISCYNKTSVNEEVIVLDGVRELLNELDKHNVLMGLVTGNLEPIGRDKLRKVGLSQYFKVGGFGSDDICRSNLVKLAIKKAKENFNFNGDVFLFGDTPEDIEAGKKARVRTVGVATGIYSKEQLKNSGADFVLENLEDTNKILETIWG